MGILYNTRKDSCISQQHKTNGAFPMRDTALIENFEEGMTIDSFADLARRIDDKDARRRQRLLDASRIENEPISEELLRRRS